MLRLKPDAPYDKQTTRQYPTIPVAARKIRTRALRPASGPTSLSFPNAPTLRLLALHVRQPERLLRFHFLRGLQLRFRHLASFSVETEWPTLCKSPAKIQPPPRRGAPAKKPAMYWRPSGLGLLARSGNYPPQLTNSTPVDFFHARRPCAGIAPAYFSPLVEITGACRPPVVHGPAGRVPAPTTYSAVSLTPSIPRSCSILDSAGARVQ